MNIAVKRDPQFDNWLKLLENQQQPGKHELPAPQEREPDSGYYRNRLVPIAIWRDEAGTLLCVRGGGDYGQRVAADPVKEWTWCYGHPVTYQVYAAVCEGAVWPDVDETVSSLVAPSMRGHNQPPPDDPTEALNERIEAALSGVSKYEKIASDEQSARAQTLRDLLNKYGLEGEKAEKAITAPLQEQIKAAWAKWKPIYNKARDAAKQIARSMEAWEDEKARRVREATRLAAEEQARLARETQPEGWPDAPPAPISTAPQQPTQIRGGTGKAASERKVPTFIPGDKQEDWNLLWQTYSAEQELRTLLVKFAQRDVDRGLHVPGGTVELRSRIR